MGSISKTVLSRLAQGLLVAWLVSTVCFLLTVSLPGDLALRVALARYGEDLPSQETVDYIRSQEGLGQPILVQYQRWLAGLARLQLGHSLSSGLPVDLEVWFHLGNTAKLAFCALILSLLVAAPLGLWCGLRPGGWGDGMVAAGSSALVALPGFLVGALLILGLAIEMRWLPAAGFSNPDHIVLPALTLALGLAALSNRVIRTALVEVKDSYYLLFARLKGLPRLRVFWAHALRNLAAPVVTFLGLQLAHVMDGAVVVESLFGWPGLGNLLLNAVNARDIPVIQAAALCIGLIYVLVNLMADLICLWLDPRQRLERTGA